MSFNRRKYQGSRSKSTAAAFGYIHSLQSEILTACPPCLEVIMRRSVCGVGVSHPGGSDDGGSRWPADVRAFGPTTPAPSSAL